MLLDTTTSSSESNNSEPWSDVDIRPPHLEKLFFKLQSRMFGLVGSILAFVIIQQTVSVFLVQNVEHRISLKQAIDGLYIQSWQAVTLWSLWHSTHGTGGPTVGEDSVFSGIIQKEAELVGSEVHDTISLLKGGFVSRNSIRPAFSERKKGIIDDLMVKYAAASASKIPTVIETRFDLEAGIPTEVFLSKNVKNARESAPSQNKLMRLVPEVVSSVDISFAVDFLFCFLSKSTSTPFNLTEWSELDTITELLSPHSLSEFSPLDILPVVNEALRNASNSADADLSARLARSQATGWMLCGLLVFACVLIVKLVFQPAIESMETEAIHRITEHSGMVRMRTVASMKSTFLAHMSHEIRSPLNGILGICQLLLDSDTLYGENYDYLREMYSCGMSLLAILNDILDFSKLQEGKLELENRSFNLRQLLSNVIAVAGQQATTDSKNLSIGSAIHPNVPWTMVGDSIRIRQVVTNFLTNAIKFTPKGYICIQVTRIESSSAAFTNAKEHKIFRTRGQRRIAKGLLQTLKNVNESESASGPSSGPSRPRDLLGDLNVMEDIGGGMGLSEMSGMSSAGSQSESELKNIAWLLQSDKERGLVGLKFTIRDTGIGIAPENTRKLFSAFTQADNKISRKFGGTGLGLSICKQFAELMGGKTGVRSRFGHGSEFWFTAVLKADAPQSEDTLNAQRDSFNRSVGLNVATFRRARPCESLFHLPWFQAPCPNPGTSDAIALVLCSPRCADNSNHGSMLYRSIHFHLTNLGMYCSLIDERQIKRSVSRAIVRARTKQKRRSGVRMLDVYLFVERSRSGLLYLVKETLMPSKGKLRLSTCVVRSRFTIDHEADTILDFKHTLKHPISCMSLSAALLDMHKALSSSRPPGFDCSSSNEYDSSGLEAAESKLRHRSCFRKKRDDTRNDADSELVLGSKARNTPMASDSIELPARASESRAPSSPDVQSSRGALTNPRLAVLRSERTRLHRRKHRSTDRKVAGGGELDAVSSQQQQDRAFVTREVIVVDDAPASRRILRMLVAKTLNVSVSTAHNGAVGLERVYKNMIKARAYCMAWRDANPKLLDPTVGAYCSAVIPRTFEGLLAATGDEPIELKPTDLLPSTGEDTDPPQLNEPISLLCGVLLDTNMPVMGGYECAERLSRAESRLQWPHLSACAITGDVDTESECKKHVSFFLPKPVLRDDLKELLTKVDAEGRPFLGPLPSVFVPGSTVSPQHRRRKSSTPNILSNMDTPYSDVTTSDGWNRPRALRRRLLAEAKFQGTSELYKSSPRSSKFSDTETRRVRSGLSVLVVEDNPTHLRILCLFLKKLGINNISQASTPQAAFSLMGGRHLWDACKRNCGHMAKYHSLSPFSATYSRALQAAKDDSKSRNEPTDLVRAGGSSTQAPSEATALRFTQEEIKSFEFKRHDVILLDCILGEEINGYWICEVVRKLEEQLGMKKQFICGVSSHVLKSNQDACSAAGMDDFLGKPIEIQELKNVLARAIAMTEERAPKQATTPKSDGAKTPPKSKEANFAVPSVSCDENADSESGSALHPKPRKRKLHL